MIYPGKDLKEGTLLKIYDEEALRNGKDELWIKTIISFFASTFSLLLWFLSIVHLILTKKKNSRLNNCFQRQKTKLSRDSSTESLELLPETLQPLHEHWLEVKRAIHCATKPKRWSGFTECLFLSICTCICTCAFTSTCTCLMARIIIIIIIYASYLLTY